jgi:hypothetical protein
MENRKPLNFAQALRSKPGRPPEQDADAQPSTIVDAHIEESQTPLPMKVDAQIEEMRTPTVREAGRPRPAETDAHTRNVDANASTQVPVVDANAPTRQRRGRTPRKGTDAHKSDRHSTDLVRQHFRIPPDLDKKFRLFRAEQGLELQEFYQLAGVHFIESVGVHNVEGVDALASHEDRRKMIWKASSTIINLYLQYLPDNKWKARDDREAKRYNDADPRLIELGILHALIRTEHRRIHSFKYFVEEIEENLAVPLADETLDVMLRRRREQWRAKQERDK